MTLIYKTINGRDVHVGNVDEKLIFSCDRGFFSLPVGCVDSFFDPNCGAILDENMKLAGSYDMGYVRDKDGNYVGHMSFATVKDANNVPVGYIAAENDSERFAGCAALLLLF